MTTLYGSTTSEDVAEKNLVCRQVVKNIIKFGIDERQKMLIIYLLALEIEDVEKMQTLTSVIKEIVGEEVFLTSRSESGG